MAFTLNNNTILLLIVLGFLAYYFYSDSKEGFKQRGVSKSSRGLSKKGRFQPKPQILFETPTPVKLESLPIPVQMVQTVQEPVDDFAGLL